MTLILIIVLNFLSTNKIGRTRRRHHFEDKENINLLIFWLQTKVGVES